MGGTHRVNAGYTLLARLIPERVAEAQALLAACDRDPQRLPFARTTTTHFATITVIPEQHYGDEVLPATLLLATTFCGPVRAHVTELVGAMGDGLREVLAHCADFIAGCADADLEAFLLEHRHGDTFYTGMQHLRPIDIKRHDELRRAIEDHVDGEQASGALAGKSADAIHRAIQEHVRATPGLEWASEPIELPAGSWWALHWRTVIVEIVALTVVVALLAGTVATLLTDSPTLATIVQGGWIALGAFVALLLVVAGGVLHAERCQTYVSGRQPDDHVRTTAATQNRPVTNEFTVAGPVKEGALRPVALKLAMWGIARYVAGIPGFEKLRDGVNIPTVASARWIASDGGRRLIFISSYTNASEPYVRDFIDVEAGAKRINLTFGFGRGYPKTRWVVQDGAVTNPNGFIHVVTENQRPTGFWYGPYAELSIDNIKRNRDIHRGLFGPCEREASQKWLHLL